MVWNQVVMFAIALALLLSAPLHAAWHGAAGGELLGKRMPALPLLAAQADARVVLVDFCDVQCGPCRENAALLDGWQRDFGAHGLTIVGIARAPPAQPAACAGRAPHGYVLRSDPDGALFSQLGLSSLPSALLVDRNGMIVWQGDPATLNRATIEQTLAAPALGELMRF